MRLSSVSWFNDPFDGYGIVTGKLSDESCWHFIKQYRESLQKLFVDEFGPRKSLIEASNEEYVDLVLNLLENPKQSYFLAEAMREWFIASRYQMLCLSCKEGYDPSNDILLWSHYADSCRGMRFELELEEEQFPGLRLKAMRYKNRRPMLNLSKMTTWDDNDLELNRFIEDCLWKKSPVWEYENEARLVIDLQKCVCNVGQGYDEKGKYNYAYVELPDFIRHVDFGCSVEKKDVDDLKRLKLGPRCLNVISFSKMNLSLEEYRIDYVDLS